MKKEDICRDDLIKILSDGGHIGVSNDGTYLCVTLADQHGEFYILCSMDIKKENMVILL